MSTIKSDTADLTLNADGASSSLKLQIDGVEKASVSAAGAFTSTSIDATKLTGALPAIDGAALTGVSSVGGAVGLSLNDNVKAQFGAGNDLQLWHDGVDSHIKHSGATLYIDADALSIRNGAGNESISSTAADGAVTLYHDNSSKIATTSTGCSVTGTLAATAVTGDGSGLTNLPASAPVAGDGINVSGTTVSVKTDLRHGVQYIGYDAGDYIYWDNSVIDFYCNSAHRARLANNGDFHADGDLIAYSTTIPSDIRLKTDVSTVENALYKVNQIRGVEFTRTHTGERGAGVIAQELETVLPQAVKEKELPLQVGDGEKYKVVEYDALHALLIESIKELSKRVEELEAR